MELTAAVPMIEWYVLTECGRHLARMAPDYDTLFLDLTEHNFRAQRVLTMTEYEAELEAQYQQQALVHELNEAVEEESAA